jgi:hypothetical protein
MEDYQKCIKKRHRRCHLLEKHHKLKIIKVKTQTLFLPWQVDYKSYKKHVKAKDNK